MTNKLIVLALSGAYDVSEALNITAQVYRRSSDRDALNGDAYEGFDDFSIDHDAIADPTQPDSCSRATARCRRAGGRITSGLASSQAHRSAHDTDYAEPDHLWRRRAVELEPRGNT